MNQEQLFPLIRQKARDLLGGYIQAAEVAQEIDSYIMPAGLGDRSGNFGAFVLAEKALTR